MKTLFNDNWYFCRTAPEEEAGQYAPVPIPHDWLIGDANNLYESSYGHYRKRYDFGSVSGRRIRLYFEGVYMDCTVYVNDAPACDWKYGYTSFEADLTPFLHDGENEISVLVRHLAPNSRWYSGAGIFRDVWLVDTPESHLVTDGVYFHAEAVAAGGGRDLAGSSGLPGGQDSADSSGLRAGQGSADDSGLPGGQDSADSSGLRAGQDSADSSGLRAGQGSADGSGLRAGRDISAFFCSISAETEKADGAGVRFLLRNGEKLLFEREQAAEKITSVQFTLDGLEKEDIWDIDSPNLLTLEVILTKDGAELDRIVQKTGIRHIRFTPDEGFFLNGRKVKLHGVCLHHDLGCLGAAFNRSAARRQLKSMLDMGVNAVRTSHNPPAPGFMELCDEMGILVNSEAFDIWERSKTEYDYARFFGEWYEKDVASWIRRDRNHPSVIMWSVGNEIYDAHVSPRGCEVIRLLHAAVKAHDPLGNAPTTHGSNYMPWEGAQRCTEEVELAGYNYGESLYADHHKTHPGWKIYGSETTSGVKSRGVYHFPRSAAFLTHEDLQCSSLGNCRAGISADTPQKIIALDRDCEYCAGMFIWTGSDYIGEPSPYSTKNAYFGSIDTAGLKKDSFYLYRAAWTKEPVLHLMPWWDFNEGQLIDVVAYTNLSEVELFVNGRSQGKKCPAEYTAAWQIPYEAGELLVQGRDSLGHLIEDRRHSFGDSAKLVLQCDRHTVAADGEDLVAVEISTVDRDGYAVENARDRVRIEVTGGWLAGFDNGDSTDYESYKAPERKLFSGRAAVYIIPDTCPGELVVNASAEGLDSATLVIQKVTGLIREGISLPGRKPAGRPAERGNLPAEKGCAPAEKGNLAAKEGSPSAAESNLPAEGEASAEERRLPVGEKKVPVRKIALVRDAGSLLTPDRPCCHVAAEIFPANAGYRDLVWSVVTNSGIPTNAASVFAEGDTALVTALGDGSFRLRCSCNNGKPQAEVISEYEFTAEGFGQACFDPYAFLPACHYTSSLAVMDEVSRGGVNIKASQNIVGFTKTDFGKYGTDRFLIRVINWHKDDPFTFRLWIGNPGEDHSECLGTFTYQANFIWQTYQDNHYTLPHRLTGLRDLFFEFEKTDMRIDFGGFQFAPRLKAYEKLDASDCDLIHGDSYEIAGSRITGIGNNVVLSFEDMDFEEGISEVRLTGRTRHDNDSIHLHFEDETGILHREIIEFPYSEDYTTVSQKLVSQKLVPRNLPAAELTGQNSAGEPARSEADQSPGTDADLSSKASCRPQDRTDNNMTDKLTVKLQFLPGCDFDFESIQFVPWENTEAAEDAQ